MQVELGHQLAHPPLSHTFCSSTVGSPSILGPCSHLPGPLGFLELPRAWGALTCGGFRGRAAAGRGGAGGEAVGGGAGEALAGGQRVVEAGGEAAARVQHGGLLRDLLKKRLSPGEEKPQGSRAPPTWRQTPPGGGKPLPLGGKPRPLHLAARTRTPFPAPHLSWVSRRRLRLLLRAMRPLATFLRAGPTLIDVFSSAVVRRDILLPLWGKEAGREEGSGVGGPPG